MINTEAKRYHISKKRKGGFGEMCKTVEDYAKKYAKDYAKEHEKIEREMILSMDYSETELEAVEQELFAQT